jgi:hypothetical protein
MVTVTSELKDSVLRFLLTHYEPEQVYDRGDTNYILSTLHLDYVSLNAILKQMEQRGYIANLRLTPHSLGVKFRQDGADFIQRGGFYAQDELLKNNIEKLLLEIEYLRQELAPKHLESAEKIVTIGAGILTALSFFK